MLKLINSLKFKLTIFQKLLIGIIAMLMLIAIIAYVGIGSVNKLENTSKIILEESNKYNNLQNLKLNFTQLLMPANDYLIHGNNVEILNFKKLDSITRQQLEISNAFENDHFNKHFLEEIEDILQEVESLSKKIFELKDPVGNTEGALMMEVMDGIVINAGEKIDILSSTSSLTMSEHIDANQVTNSEASKIIMIVVVFIMISLVTGGFYYVKEITKTIENLASIVKKVTSGDLVSKANVTIRTHDEIDNFANLFNNMIGVLSETTVSRDYFNSVIQKINESLIITTIGGNILIVNKATLDLLEYSEEELIGESIEKILLGDHKNVRTTLEEETAQNIFNTYYSKSKIAIPVSFSKSFIYDKNNNKTGILYLAYNQTEILDEKHKPIGENFKNNRKINIKEEIPLTNRELEVIKLIVKDYSSQEIADKLFISIRTVETHRKNIMGKLHAKSIIGLVHYAIQNHLI
jgi:PAS domain S-box-containing protein